MTPKERVFAMLAHKPVDRVPVMPFICNWAAHVAGYKLGEYHTNGKIMAEAQLKAWKLHGLDLVNPDSDNYYIAEGLGVKTQIMEDSTPTVIDRPVKELDDVKYLQIPDPYKDGRMPVILEAIERLADAVGDQVIVRSPGTGPFSLAGHLYGVGRLIESICFAEADEDEEAKENLHRMLDICTDTLIEFSTACVKKGATIVINGDSLASINITSPSVYREYCYRYEKKYFDAMKRLQKDHEFAALLHVCGKNDLVAADMMQTGPDIIEVDYACDMDLYKELSTRSGVCILGNLNPAGTLMTGSPEEVYRESMALLEQNAKDGFFMLGSGCELAVSSPLENVRAMLRAAEDFAAK